MEQPYKPEKQNLELEELLKQHKIATENAHIDRWDIVRNLCPHFINEKAFEWLKSNYIIHKK